MSESTVVASLQMFLNKRSVNIEHLRVDQMVVLMIDWFRMVPIDGVAHTSPTDTMSFRYGGWSEGCVTGFKFGLHRRITTGTSDPDWLVGITLMFEPSRYADIAPLNTVSTDWQSLEAFVHAIESSPGFRLSASLTPMAVMLESQGFR